MKKFLEGLISSIYSGFSVSPDNLVIDPSMLAVSAEIWEYFQFFAIALSLVYFLIEINRRWGLEGRDLTMKSMFEPVLKFGLSMVVLRLAPTIVLNVVYFGNSVILYFSGDGEVKMNLNNASSVFSKLGLVELMVATIPLLFCWIVSVVLSLVFLYKTLMFKMELLLRIGFTPIAMADVYSGQNSNAIKWIKSLLAHGLYGACFLLIPHLGNSILVGFLSQATNGLDMSSLWNVIRYLVTALVVPFAEIGMLSAAKQLTREVLGC